MMYFYVSTSASGDDDADAPGYAGRVPIKYYDDIVNQRLNPFKFYYNNSERIIEDADPGGSYNVNIFSFDPLSSLALRLMKKPSIVGNLNSQKCLML